MSGASIYILLCADGSYYTGVTQREVEERVGEHAQGLIPGAYMASRRPVKLVFSEAYERVDEAIATERRIKGWSRAKKEAYMRGDFASLVALAKTEDKDAALIGVFWRCRFEIAAPPPSSFDSPACAGGSG